MLSKKIKLFFSRLCFSVAYLSPALGLILMGHLDKDWVACIVVMTVCESGKTKFGDFFYTCLYCKRDSSFTICHSINAGLVALLSTHRQTHLLFPIRKSGCGFFYLSLFLLPPKFVRRLIEEVEVGEGINQKLWSEEKGVGLGGKKVLFAHRGFLEKNRITHKICEVFDIFKVRRSDQNVRI